MTPEELKNKRKLLGMTQVELADDLEVSEGAIRAWESGRTAIPKMAARLISMMEVNLCPTCNQPLPKAA